MKKIELIFAVAVIVFSVLFSVGCGKKESVPERAVVCTTYPVWLIARDLMLGAENAPELSLLVPPNTGCPHDYALSTGDLLRLSRIRDLLFLSNGGGLDGSIVHAAKKAQPNLKVISATGLEIMGEEEEHEHGHEHEHEGPDPHYFTAPGTTCVMVANMAKALKEFDPSNEKIYAENEAKLLNRLAALSARAEKLLQGRKLKVIAMHGTAVHFAQETGLDIRSIVFTGHESALSSSAMNELIARIRNEKISLLITEPQTPESAAELLKKETGILEIPLDFAASGPENVPNGYLPDRIENNLTEIEVLLKKNEAGK